MPAFPSPLALLVSPRQASQVRRFRRDCEALGVAAGLLAPDPEAFGEVQGFALVLSGPDLPPTSAGSVSAGPVSADIDRAASLLRGHDLRAVVPGSLAAVPFADRLAARVGLPHNVQSEVASRSDLRVMRVLFDRFQIPLPPPGELLGAAREALRHDLSGLQGPLTLRFNDLTLDLPALHCADAASLQQTLKLLAASPLAGAALWAEPPSSGQAYLADVVVGGGLLRQVFVTRRVLRPGVPVDTAVAEAVQAPTGGRDALLHGQDLGPRDDQALRISLTRIVKAWSLVDTALQVEFTLDSHARTRVVTERVRTLPDASGSAALILEARGYSLERAYLAHRLGRPVVGLSPPARRCYGWLPGGRSLPPVLPEGVSQVGSSEADVTSGTMLVSDDPASLLACLVSGQSPGAQSPGAQSPGALESAG